LLDHQERDRFYEQAGRLYELPILVDDTANTSVLEIRARCQRLQMERGLAMVVIDYLQLIAPSKRRDSRQQEVSDISRDLKILAKELHIPVIALSQLSRAVEQRGDKVPVLSDLRESGAIEQDADVVMFIYRGDMQQDTTDPSIKLIIAKQRNGPLGDVPLVFHKTYARFDPLASDHEYAMAAVGNYMSDESQTMKELLLSYISLMAERHGFAPGDNFEYRLWDTLHGSFADTQYVSLDEGAEIIYLAVETDSWVTYNDETRMFELIDLDEWEELIKKRGN